MDVAVRADQAAKPRRSTPAFPPPMRGRARRGSSRWTHGVGIRRWYVPRWRMGRSSRARDDTTETAEDLLHSTQAGVSQAPGCGRWPVPWSYRGELREEVPTCSTTAQAAGLTTRAGHAALLNFIAR